jgi:undecaprenyl diphosphate synthase
MKLFRRALKELTEDDRFGTDKDTRICFIGKKEMFPKDIQEQMLAIEQKTKNHDTYRINFCMAYGGREEIIDAIHNIAQKVARGDISASDINEDCVRNHLWLEDDPDLIIRTSGEIRTSNFLPFQSAYSEWMFPECRWPEFDEKKLDACLTEYGHRNRRFGK